MKKYLINSCKFQEKHSFSGHQERQLFNFSDVSWRQAPAIFGNGQASCPNKTNISQYLRQIVHCVTNSWEKLE